MGDDASGSLAQPRPAQCCKVGRLIDRYGLTSMDERLASRWLGTNGDRLGLRDLKSFFNRAVLRAAMQEVGLDPLDGEVRDIYELLVAEEPGGRNGRRARSRLERAGIDTESLPRDFVSHPTVGAHLKECLGVEPPQPAPGDKVAIAEERVFKLQNRTEAVVRATIEHLRDTDRLEASDFDVFVSARVTCDRCGTQYDVHEFLRRRGCDCGVDP